MSKLPKFFPYVGSGTEGNEGFNPLAPNHDWDWLWNNVDESPFARQCREHGGGWGHNCGGRYEPMLLNQWEVTRQHAASHPLNTLLQHSADSEKFTEALCKFKEEDLWCCIYFGGNEWTPFPDTVTTPTEWKDWALEKLSPALSVTPIVDAIGFDAVLGREYPGWDANEFPGLNITSGRHGGMSLLIRELRRRGYLIFIEPFTLQSADWLSFCSAAIVDRTKDQKDQRGWWVRDHLGNQVTVRQPKEHAGNPVLFLRNSWEKTDAGKLEDVERANDEGYAATIVSHEMPRVM